MQLIKLLTMLVKKKLKPRKVKLGSLSYLILGSKKYYSNDISYDGCNKNDDFEEIRIK